MTRHQRRKAARKRKDERAEGMETVALAILRHAIVSRNLANAKRPERTPRGLKPSSIYSGQSAAVARGMGVSYGRKR